MGKARLLPSLRRDANPVSMPAQRGQRTIRRLVIGATQFAGPPIIAARGDMNRQGRGCLLSKFIGLGAIRGEQEEGWNEECHQEGARRILKQPHG